VQLVLQLRHRTITTGDDYSLTGIIFQCFVPNQQTIEMVGADPDSGWLEGSRYSVHAIAMLMDGGGLANVLVSGARTALHPRFAAVDPARRQASGHQSNRAGHRRWTGRLRRIGAGRERAAWELMTLDEVPTQELMRGVDLLSVRDSKAVMQVRFKASSPGSLTMICEYDSVLPEPMRIGAASVTWRSIDERIARLWLIGSVPRARYPEFMRQRRDLLHPLPVNLQLHWLALSLVRLEPLMATLAGRTSGFRTLVEKLSPAGGERDVLLVVADAISSVEDVAGAPADGDISSMPKRPIWHPCFLRSAPCLKIQ
jgi:hypothetical protein